MTLNPPAAQYRHGDDECGTEHVVRQQKDGEVHSWPANFEDRGTDGALVHGAQPEGAKLRVLDLFSGIGGFSLGLERATLPGAEINGFETVAFCEIESFPRKVLAKHWPDVPCYDDVRTLTAERLAADGIAVDVITGGFPCQDISHAGRQAGITEGTRSGLWSEIARLVGELAPSFVIVENVAALLSGPSERRGGWHGRVLGDLADLGYDAEWHRIRAGAVGLPQERQRIWILAYPHEVGRQAPYLEAPFPYEAGAFREWEQVELCGTRSGNARWLPVARNWRVGDGVPSQLDIARTECVGNAVVPQIPELIGNAILQSLHDTRGTIANRNAPALSGSPVLHSSTDKAKGQ